MSRYKSEESFVARKATLVSMVSSPFDHCSWPPSMDKGCTAQRLVTLSCEDSTARAPLAAADVNNTVRISFRIEGWEAFRLIARRFAQNNSRRRRK
jgi:hypothetical protein